MRARDCQPVELAADADSRRTVWREQATTFRAHESSFARTGNAALKLDQGIFAMSHHPFAPLLRRWLAGLLSVLIGLGPIATPSFAALTNLADEPLNVKNQAKPNVVLTVDDSTSMLYDFLPDYVVNNYCSIGAMNAPCGFNGSPVGVAPGDPYGYYSPQYIWQQVLLPYPS